MMRGARDLDRIHLFLLGLAPYAYVILVLSSFVGFLLAIYLAIFLPGRSSVPSWSSKQQSLPCFWAWHVVFRRRSGAKPPSNSSRLSGWVAALALALTGFGVWGVFLLEKGR
jgi:hypothetical protein